MSPHSFEYGFVGITRPKNSKERIASMSPYSFKYGYPPRQPVLYLDDAAYLARGGGRPGAMCLAPAMHIVLFLFLKPSLRFANGCRVFNHTVVLARCQ